LYLSLYDIVKAKQLNIELNNTPFVGISIYIYKYYDSYIDKTPDKFDSISEASKKIGMSRDSIRIYINTNVPYKGLLFYTNQIKNFELTHELAKKSTIDLDLDRSIAKEV